MAIMDSRSSRLPCWRMAMKWRATTTLVSLASSNASPSMSSTCPRSSRTRIIPYRQTCGARAGRIPTAAWAGFLSRTNERHPLMKTCIAAPLDPDFQPAVLFSRHYIKAAKASGQAVSLVIGLERENGLLSRFETVVKSTPDAETLRYVERLVKFLLWARGGWRIWMGGPPEISEHIAHGYSKFGARGFDTDLMSRVYERPFEVVVTSADSVHVEHESAAALGGHLDGCRIGFDLGASDYKVAAVKDGEVVYSDEFRWNPKDKPDPNYHYEHLNSDRKRVV